MKVKIGSRSSIQRTTGFLKFAFAMLRFPSADLHGRVVHELVGRHREIPGRRPLADAAGRVVMRAVARAEPAAVVAPRLALLGADRPEADVRANPDHAEAFRGLDPLLCGPAGPQFRA